MKKSTIIFTIFIFIVFSNCNKVSKDQNANKQIDNKFGIELKNDSSTVEEKLNDEYIIELVPSSINCQNDSLYFTYKIVNQSLKNMLFYHIQLLAISLDSSSICNFPKCNMYIYDNNGRLPSNVYVSIGEPRKQEPIQYSINGYIVLKSNEVQKFERVQYIGNLGLTSGEYKFQLKYFSPPNEYYQQQFDRLRKKTQSLKDCNLFHGIIESNICSFIYQ